MSQFYAFEALEIARQRMAEAQAEARVAYQFPPRPSLTRRVLAGSLRWVHGAAASLAHGADALAQRLEGRTA